MAAKDKKCMIIGGAPIKSARIFKEYDPKEFFVICADRGYETALKHGITPNLIVGDFDSATQPPPEDLQSISLPVEKDVTDTMYAVMRGMARGFRSFVLLGCLGGERFDHSIANIEVLKYINYHGGRAVLADEHTKVFLLKDDRLTMTQAQGTAVSVFPYGCESCNVSYKGLKYPLIRKDLTFGGLLMGVSNRVEEDRAEVRVHEGTALVVVYQP